MKKLILITTILLLMGCDKETSDQTEQWSLPQGLTDCRIYRMSSTSGNSMTVMRCPFAETSNTYRVGKTTQTVTVTETVAQ